MEWKKLLYAPRSESLDIPEDMNKYPMNDFEQDYWRIVNSAPFRRLQDKTQVFPLDKSDFVRTRLTHSVETSALAKQLTTMITANIRKNKGDTPYAMTEEEARDAANAAMCAGLLHDIGNPPFGHFGEVVIGDWFKTHLGRLDYKGKPLEEWLDGQMRADLCRFEGNAQALRLLTKVYRVDSAYGMDLMPAVLNTLVKYPVASTQADPGYQAPQAGLLQGGGGAVRPTGRLHRHHYGGRLLPSPPDLHPGGGGRHRLRHCGSGGRLQKGSLHPGRV